MSSPTSSADSNDMWQTLPSRSGSPEITWLGTTSGTQFTPREFLQYRAQLVISDHIDNIDPLLLTPENQGENTSRRGTPEIDESPRAIRAHRRNNITSNIPSHRRNSNPSPRAQREIERLEQYQRKKMAKQELRRIIFLIQSKRREEFRVLREALGQVFNYTGRYLQKLGEKKKAAHIIREGGLGSEFVNLFHKDVKWKWLQTRVNNI